MRRWPDIAAPQPLWRSWPMNWRRDARAGRRPGASRQPSGPLNAVSAGAVIARCCRVGHRGRRIQHRRGHAVGGHRRFPARCADPDRRRDRLRPAGRGRCGAGRPDRPVLEPCRPTARRCTRSPPLWTQARENLDVTTVIFNNGAYDIPVDRVAAGGRRECRIAGPKALDLLDLGRPTIDFVKIAEGMGCRRGGPLRPKSWPLRSSMPSPSPDRI